MNTNTNTNTDIVKVYLAGKIQRNCWRHDIVPGLRDAGGYEPPEPVYFGDGLEYVGPFFIACDHGCSHGPHTHGRAFNACNENQTGGQDFAFKTCLHGIRQADLIFAWIEDATCYGTLAEIGFAYAWGKPVYIASPKGFPKDLWFAGKMSHFMVHENCSSAGEMLNRAVTKFRTTW